MNILSSIRWWFRRHFDRITYDSAEIESEFVAWIVPRLKRYKEIQHGYPEPPGLKKWNKIIDKMIEGFEIRLNEQHWEWKPGCEGNRRKVQQAFDLFAKYHDNLWD